MQEIENIHELHSVSISSTRLIMLPAIKFADFYLRWLHKPPIDKASTCWQGATTHWGTHKSYTQGDLRRRRLSSPHIGCVGEQDDYTTNWEHLEDPGTNWEHLGAFGRPRDHWECQRWHIQGVPLNCLPPSFQGKLVNGSLKLLPRESIIYAQFP